MTNKTSKSHFYKLNWNFWNFHFSEIEVDMNQEYPGFHEKPAVEPVGQIIGFFTSFLVVTGPTGIGPWIPGPKNVFWKTIPGVGKSLIV